MAELPRQIWHFVAWLDGQPVGHSTLCLTRGSLGIAGIYGVGVAPTARNRGVGKAVVAAACQQARELGARIAMLNGTGERMYRQLGFERLGYGQTWWLNVMRLVMRWPSQQRIALAEAVGRGDLGALAALARQGWARAARSAAHKRDDAAGAGRPRAAAAVGGVAARPGVALELLPAWDLGWKDRVVHLLEAQPELANQRSGEMEVTPLHTAVERNDLELARVLLAARPDSGDQRRCVRRDAAGLGQASPAREADRADRRNALSRQTSDAVRGQFVKRAVCLLQQFAVIGFPGKCDRCESEDNVPLCRRRNRLYDATA